jgi:hypothetical protein
MATQLVTTGTGNEGGSVSWTTDPGDDNPQGQSFTMEQTATVTSIKLYARKLLGAE